jgi:hypothetical protein
MCRFCKRELDRPPKFVCSFALNFVSDPKRREQSEWRRHDETHEETDGYDFR